MTISNRLEMTDWVTVKCLHLVAPPSKRSTFGRTDNPKSRAFEGYPNQHHLSTDSQSLDGKLIICTGRSDANG